MTTPSSFFAPFRTRLVLLMLVVILPALGLVLYSNLEQRRVEKVRVWEGATAITRLAAANQESFIKNAHQLLATLAQFSFLVLATNRQFCEMNFSNLRKLSPDYVNFGLIETNGILFCSADPTNVAVDLGDRAYFKRVIQTRKFSAGDFQVGRLTGVPALNFGYPVIDEHGQLRRVVYASLKLSLLSEAIGQIPLPAGGTVMVFDRKGNVLAGQPEPEKWVGKSLSETPAVQRTLAQGEGVFEAPGWDAASRLYAVTGIKDEDSPGMFVSVGIPVAVCLAPVNQALTHNLVIVAVVSILVWLLVHLYAKRFFLLPVRALATGAGELATGNLDARILSDLGSAELIDLGRAFNEMAERLQKRQEEVEQANENIGRLNQDLERRVAERTTQLETANKELEAFSYSVSHDLRAPLRHMVGFVNLLKKNKAALDEKNLRHLDFIVGSAEQMGKLVDDLLNFSRMSRVELRRTRVNLEEVVAEARRGLEAEMNGRDVQWTVRPLPEVEADRAMLRVVFNNLLANAIKYTRQQQRTRIEIGCSTERDEHVVFVRDNGVGFDMQYAGKLFGVFQRLHHEDEFEGTGIGLANVQRVVLRHGGRVWAEGKEGEGATFYFSLPTNSSVPAAKTQAANHPQQLAHHV